MIIIHEDFNHIYQSLIEKFVEKPDYKVTNKDGETLYEFINPSITILRPMNCFALCRGMSLSYLKGELEWYYSGSPYKEDITKYSKFWEKLFPKKPEQKNIKPVNYITVENIDEYSEKVSSLGGKILMSKQKVPTVGYIALAIDPEGNSFGLLQPERQ